MNQEILSPGMVFQSRYEVLSRLREGGLVFAYQGRQLATGQPIVLEVARLDWDGAPADLARIRGARFLRQMRCFARLQHPCIVRPIDAGQTDDGQLYAVFGLVSGQSLSELLTEQGALEPQEARGLMRQVLDALACAHRHGMIHGDLQPSHVMAVQAGALRGASVLGFGFGALAAAARACRGEALVSSSELVTWQAYAAPEQLRGYPPTARSDLYAWGLVFLECLTGRRVGRGPSPRGVAPRPGSREPATIPRPLLEHPLGAILRRATLEDIAARDVTADGLLCEVDACEVSGLRREDLIPNDAPSGADGTRGRREDIAGPTPTAPGQGVTTHPDDPNSPGISGEEPALTLTLPEASSSAPCSGRAPAAVPLRTGAARSPTEPVEDRAPMSIGAPLKHYEIIRKLGQGGMAVVYLARDTRLGRLVAIKFLLSYTGRRIERFLDEARATARCRHENIVVIHEVDEILGCPYLVLEYIKGPSLRAWMTQRELPGAPGSSAAPAPPGSRGTGAVVEAMIPVVRALVCAHGLGIVHRDLKPENILVDDSGCTKVVDFGLAKRIEASCAPALTGAAALPGDAGEHRKRGAVGTPRYMAPEQLLGSDVDGRADLWAVGVILVELLTGEHPLEPFSLARLPEIVNLDLPMPGLSARRPELGALGALIDRCLKKRKAERIGSARELLAELEALAPGRRALRLGEDDSPFAGLFAFQEADAARFFGRDRDIAAMTTRLRSQQLMVLVGPSGAGKSSFVRAGVIPALKRSEDRWEAFVLRPGRRPLYALADVLAQVAAAERASGATAPGDAMVGSPELPDHDGLVATLRAQPGYLGAGLRARCRREATARRILLFVDQFEELYTLGAAPEERAAFVACLEGAADDASSPLRVLLAVRSDFLERMADDRGFIRDVTGGLWFLPPMGRDDLREALTRPIEAAGYRFETAEMVEHMLGMLESTRSPLPLLQFTAGKLWDARDRARRLVTRDSYERLGGVAGALSAHADAVLSALPSREQRLVRAVLLRLVTPERTRAVVRLDELQELAPGGEGDGAEAIAQVVQHLAGARLLLLGVGGEAGGERVGPTVELVHESLIERWPKLGQWLAENEQDAQFVARLRVAAQQWEASGGAEGLIWRDRAAEEARAWYERRRAEQGAASRVELGKREERYLRAVVALAERARRVRLRQRFGMGLMATLGAAALLVSRLAIDASQQAARADQEAARAQVEAREARNATRMATARELQADPTTVLAILREIEPPDVPRGWAILARWALHSWIARAVLIHPDAALSASYSPDGERIVTTSWDKTARVWNADGTGEPVVLRGHQDYVSSAVFSPDGKRIVTASYDRTARVWNADGTGEPVVLRGHDDRVTSATFSPDGRRIVTASWDRTARVWNADGTGEPVVLHGHGDRVTSATFSPDGNRIVTASWDKTAQVRNADGTGKPIVLRGHENSVYWAAFSPDGDRIVTASWDKTARVWNTDGKREPVVLRGHEDVLYSAAFSPDGKRVVTASWDKTARVWNADGTGKPLVIPFHNKGVSSAAFSPDGKRIVTASYDRTARVWNTEEASEPMGLRGHENAIPSAAFSPDGKRIVTASWDKTARVWNADGTGEPIVLRGHEDRVTSAAFSPDGRRIVTASWDRTARIWNADGAGQPVVLRGHEEQVYSAAFSPDGKRIVTASWDKTARIWNADGSGEPVVLRGHEDQVYSAAFSPDGKRIVTASYDMTARVWNADGSGEPSVLRGHENWVLAARFSPDGTRIVTASHDMTTRVWNADGAGEPLELRASDAAVNDASFSPDGRRIVTASDDKIARVWADIEPLRGIDDPKLWAATTYCMPVEQRIDLFRVPEAMARADREACLRRVDEARAASREQR